MHDVFQSLQVFLISLEFFHSKMRVMSKWKYALSLICVLFQQPLLERFLNRAAEGFRNLFTAVEDHFELCLAKCRTSSQVSLWDLSNARSDLWQMRDSGSCYSGIKLFFCLFVCFRAFNMRTPTETLRQSIVTASPLQSYFLYEHSGTNKKTLYNLKNIQDDFALPLTWKLNFWAFKRAIAVLYVTLFTLHKCVELHTFHPWWSSCPLHQQLISEPFKSQYPRFFMLYIKQRMCRVHV